MFSASASSAPSAVKNPGYHGVGVPMTTRIMLVRHGATVLAREDHFSGSTDVELSDTGRAQAAALAQRLAKETIHAVYASPMKRTLATAGAIAAPHKLTAVPDPALREINHGHWEGLRRADVEQRFAQEYAAWEADPLLFAPDGGETGLQVLARALPAFVRIVAAHSGQAVLVVSHKATIRLLIGSFLGFDPRGYRDRLDQSPASLNILDFSDATHARLMLFNDISHYANCPGAPGAHLSKWWGKDDNSSNR
jgi:probable phosphoglycerate mutase